MNIVFDKTKGFSQTQAHPIDRTLVEILTAAADNAEINLYYITANSAKPKPRLQRLQAFDAWEHAVRLTKRRSS